MCVKAGYLMSKRITSIISLLFGKCWVNGRKKTWALKGREHEGDECESGF